MRLRSPLLALALLISPLRIPAQTIWVPGGTTTGIANNTTNSNVGVGTSAPFAKLDVEGRANFGSGTAQNSFLSADSQLQITTDNGVAAQLTFWQSGVAGAHIGHKASDSNLYVTNAYDGSALGNAARSITLTLSGAVGIGTATPSQLLDVNGSIRAGGRVRYEIQRYITGTPGDTVAIGSISNDGYGKNVRILLKAHNGSVIDVHSYEFNETAYLGSSTQWLELPRHGASAAYTGSPGYAVDIYRPNIGSPTDALYVRLRTVRSIGAGSVSLVIEHDEESAFTSLTAASTTATSFNATTAPAGGGQDGYYGALEWSFPVSGGYGWNSAGNRGLFVRNDGKVGVGTSSPTHALAVNGTVRAKEVIVDTGWADHVFADDYRLAPLDEVEAHIQEKRHLPGIPSAAEVAANGISLGEMQAKLLEKIEELTLHSINQQKQIDRLLREVTALKEARP